MVCTTLPTPSSNVAMTSSSSAGNSSALQSIFEPAELPPEPLGLPEPLSTLPLPLPPLPWEVESSSPGGDSGSEAQPKPYMPNITQLVNQSSFTVLILAPSSDVPVAHPLFRGYRARGLAHIGSLAAQPDARFLAALARLTRSPFAGSLSSQHVADPKPSGILYPAVALSFDATLVAGGGVALGACPLLPPSRMSSWGGGVGTTVTQHNLLANGTFDDGVSLPWTSVRPHSRTGRG